MGNNQSSRSVENVELASQSHEPVTLHNDATPLVLSTATKLRVEHVNDVLCVLDHATGELLFRCDEKYFPEWDEKMLVDGRNNPVAMMRREDQFRKNYLIKACVAPNKLLYKIKAWEIGMTQTVHVRSTAAAPNEKLVVEIEGRREVHKAVMWATHGKSPSEAICRITGITGAPDDKFEGFDVEVAAGVDLTIVALFCIILYELVTTNSNVPNLFLGVT